MAGTASIIAAATDTDTLLIIHASFTIIKIKSTTTLQPPASVIRNAPPLLRCSPLVGESPGLMNQNRPSLHLDQVVQPCIASLLQRPAALAGAGQIGHRHRSNSCARDKADP